MRLRIPVATVVGMVADGMGFQEILESYPDLMHAESLRFTTESGPVPPCYSGRK